MTRTDTQQIKLVRAHPHQWGSGLVHEVDIERDQTLCGKSPGGCPGTPFVGSRAEITCKACKRSLAAKLRVAELRAQWASDDQRRQEDYAAARRQWWAAYDAYLMSAPWRAKRQRVLQRAAGLCEGCGETRATQVHHLRYPRDCAPGSDEWIAKEKLFDLAAICRRCHDDMHRRTTDG